MLEQIYNLRPYHNMRHLAQMREALSEFIVISDELEIAINYHDIVYEVGSPKNEEFSAIIARRHFPDSSSFVEKYILATKHHVETGDHAIDLFLDADMSILAANTGDYDNYSRNVRKEYAKYSDAEWAVGRKQFLESFTGFITPEFSKYNGVAFENISRELKCL